MKCNICGARTAVISTMEATDGLQTDIDRRCVNGHYVQTHEVHTTMLADDRELSSAMRAIHRRIDQWKRDAAIALDKRPATKVAKEYGITDSRVRQIRIAMFNPFTQLVQKGNEE